MIFFSTGGVRSKPAAAAAVDLYKHGIPAVELSGGAYSASYEAELVALRRDILFQVHNYFPPPERPFVFNLASSSPDVLESSVQQVRSAMRLAVTLGRPVYSFHAGFRINPAVSELGQPLGRHLLQERSAALNRFGETVLMLAEEARREGVSLLVENNVLNAVNLATFGEDPLLLTSPDEIAYFMEGMPANVGLLLDVAHLKVSARSLCFDPGRAHDQVKSWIRGYHLSDNDGTADTNDSVTSESWFWEVIKTGLDYYSLEVYGLSSVENTKQYELVKASLANSNATRSEKL